MQQSLVLLSFWFAVFTFGPTAIQAEDAASPPVNVTFVAQCDGSEQKYVLVSPKEFSKDNPVDVLIALHGHGSDRWQFVRQDRPKCKAVRDVALRHGMLLVSPDYRAKTSWMGPLAEADLSQIIGELKEQYPVRRIFLCGASMGGSSCLTYAALHPDLLAGVISMNKTANHLEYQNFQDAISDSFGESKQEIPAEYKKRSAEYWPVRHSVGNERKARPSLRVQPGNNFHASVSSTGCSCVIALRCTGGSHLC